MESAEQLYQIHKDQDSFAAIDLLLRHPDPLATAAAFHEAMRDCYWKRKDLPATIAFGRAGAQYALGKAADSRDPEAAATAETIEKLKGAAKAMCYDLASFTWPGWDEPGIAISAADLAVGLDAAKANLRLARELNRGDLPLSRAHWMLAGHFLARRQWPQADSGYADAARHAAAAGARGDELLCLGFRHLTQLLAGGVEACRGEIERVKEQLKEEQDGEMFAGQIEAAARVFSK